MKLLKVGIIVLSIFFVSSAVFASQTMGTFQWNVAGVNLEGKIINRLICDVEIGQAFFSLHGAYIETGGGMGLAATGSGFVTQTGGAHVQMYFGSYYAILKLNSNLNGQCDIYSIDRGAKIDTGSITLINVK